MGVSVPKYEAIFRFGSDVTDEQAQEWITALRSALPADSEAIIKTMPLVLNLEQISDLHAGNRVRVYVGANEGYVSGILEHVYLTGMHPLSRTLVINGAAYTVPPFSNVELGEW